MKLKVMTKPVSVNQAYPTGFNGRRFLSKEGKEYKELLGWAAREFKGDPSKAFMKVKYTFGFKDKRRRDIDDYIKLTQDALSGIWFEDDCQIVAISATKEYSEEYFVEIEAEEVEQQFTSYNKKNEST